MTSDAAADRAAPANGTPPPSSPPPTRTMDARSLRGLAHPLRMRILELLRLDGADTATGLGRRLGENTGTVSWHLRHLADHGFIEEETGRGTKRERWWRAARVSYQLNTTDFRDDPDTRGALSVYVHEIVQQQFNRVVGYLTEDWEAQWRDAGTLTQVHDLRLTPEQLAALNAELMAVIDRHRAAAHTPDTPHPPHEAADRAAPARPVLIQLQSFPRRERPGG